MDKITILGHENPDVDSIISGYLLEKLCRMSGYEAEFIIPDEKIDGETLRICNYYGLDIEKYQKDLEPGTYLLVDHHERDLGSIIGVIDHHPTNKKYSYRYYQNERSSSTAMLIYHLNPSAFTKEDIKLVIVANIIDTASFHSSKTKKEDEKWSKKMCEQYHFSYQKMYEDGLSLTDLNDLEEAFLNGLKSYQYGFKKLESSYIQVISFDEKQLEEALHYLRKRREVQHLSLFVFLVHNMKVFTTTVYMIGDEIEIIHYESYTSRGETIMPMIEKRLLNSHKF